MAVRRIRVLTEPVVRRKAKRVPAIDSSIQKLIDDMVETMQQEKGVGLAAPQVGVSLRVVVLRMLGEEEAIVLINPEIVKRSGEREVTEGCLSVPGYAGRIKRSLSITVKGQDRHGRNIRLKADDLMAQALEHELDHLDGVLYLDHMESLDDLYQIEQAQEVEESI